LCPDDIETVATSLSCEPRYESPTKYTRGVLVPIYTSPAQEVAVLETRGVEHLEIHAGTEPTKCGERRGIEAQ
jgi:hypothetical protein